MARMLYRIELKQTSEALELAPIYYEYGNALLSLAEVYTHEL